MSDPPPNIQATRVGAEKEKSATKGSDEAINAIYDIISAYNGVIRKIIDLTTPVGGKWSTRKSTDNSTVMYFSSVLKGLNEPIKHLMFQLGKVRDANLASMFNMVYSLQKFIDQSPPFKMVDIAAYKNGLPNYEGLTDDLTLGSTQAYVSLLEVRLKDLNKTINESVEGFRPTLANVPKEMRTELLKIGEENIKNAKAQKALVEKEIKKSQDRIDSGLGDLQINEKILRDAEEANDTLVSQQKQAFESLAARMGAKVTIAPQSKEQKTNTTNKELLERRKIQISKIEKLYPNLKDAQGNFDANRLGPNDLAQYNQYTSDIAALDDLLKNKKEPKSTASTAPTASNVKIGVASGSCGSGAGEVNNKQQYNSMGRPLSDDQKINNDMINANRNWQVKNNPPHDTPLGNLNPFLAQERGAKYTYEVELAKQNATLHPERNALGADISLLQGPIGGMSGSGKRSKAMMKLKNVAIDEKNDPYAPNEMGTDGFIPEDQENQFKLPDLKPKKKK